MGCAAIAHTLEIYVGTSGAERFDMSVYSQLKDAVGREGCQTLIEADEPQWPSMSPQ